MGISMDVAIGLISLVVAHFITLYITVNTVTYFGVLIGVAFLACLILQRIVATASQLMSVVDTVQAARVPTTMDAGVCSALMHEPADQSDLDGTFTSYNGMPVSAVAAVTVTSPTPQPPPPSAATKVTTSCDVSLNSRLASYGT
jgi:hypothetical protein